MIFNDILICDYAASFIKKLGACKERKNSFFYLYMNFNQLYIINIINLILWQYFLTKN